MIAIFGGTSVPPEVQTFACDLGRALADAHHIVLTGGKGPEGTAVKNRAICGAGSSPWIGVARSKKATAASSSRKREPGFVITSDLGEKRNFLEALICDAAVVLQGGLSGGTCSELASALALQRPVALKVRMLVLGQIRTPQLFLVPAHPELDRPRPDWVVQEPLDSRPFFIVRVAGGRLWKRHGNDPVQPDERSASGNLPKSATFSRLSG